VREGIPYLLGTYEDELHELVEQWPHDAYQAVINVGTAEGYYAVGLAKRLGVAVYGFDCEYRERRYCRQMAVMNGVRPLIHLENWCSPSALRRLAQDRRVLVVCDCEGFEIRLFTDDAIEALRHSNILVELHSVEGVDVKSLLCERFAPTHDIRLIPLREACDPDPKLALLGPDGQRFVREVRSEPNQVWLWATSRAALAPRPLARSISPRPLP
jgi:hypothetical protein